MAEDRLEGTPRLSSDDLAAIEARRRRRKGSFDPADRARIVELAAGLGRRQTPGDGNGRKYGSTAAGTLLDRAESDDDAVWELATRLLG